MRTLKQDLGVTSSHLFSLDTPNPTWYNCNLGILEEETSNGVRGKFTH